MAGAAMLGRGLEQYAAGRAQAAETAKRERDEFKTLQQLVDVYAGDGPEADFLRHKAATMGLPELRGYIQSAVVKQTLAKEAQQAKLLNAQLAHYDQQTAAAQREMEADDAYAGLLATGRTPAGAPIKIMSPAAGMSGLTLPGFPAGYDVNRVMANVANYPAATRARGFDNLLTLYGREAGKAEPQEPLTSDWIEDPVTGSRFLGRAKTTLPSGVNPAKLETGPKITPDGSYYHDGKRWVGIKQQGLPAGSKFATVDGVVSVIGPDNRILDWKMQSPMGMMLSGESSGASPAATPVKPGPAKLPTVTTRAQFDALKSGDQYLGKDGITYRKP